MTESSTHNYLILFTGQCRTIQYRTCLLYIFSMSTKSLLSFVVFAQCLAFEKTLLLSGEGHNADVLVPTTLHEKTYGSRDFLILKMTKDTANIYCFTHVPG